MLLAASLASCLAQTKHSVHAGLLRHLTLKCPPGLSLLSLVGIPFSCLLASGKGLCHYYSQWIAPRSGVCYFQDSHLVVNAESGMFSSFGMNDPTAGTLLRWCCHDITGMLTRSRALSNQHLVTGMSDNGSFA